MTRTGSSSPTSITRVSPAGARQSERQGGGWIEPYARATLAQTSKGEARVTKDGILELEQRRFKAMCDGDADALGALLHDGLTYTRSRKVVH